MKASIPFEFTAADRLAVARFLGYDGLASHVQCVAWARHQVRGSLTIMAAAPPRPLPVGILPPINRPSTELDLDRRSV